jgi:hypothetical protein
MTEVGDVILINGKPRRVTERTPQHRIVYDAKGVPTWTLTHYAIRTEPAGPGDKPKGPTWTQPR